MLAVNFLNAVILLSVAYFNDAEARSEDDLRLYGIRLVFTKVIITKSTRTVFKTCSRARGTAFEQPIPAVDGCTTCDQATGAAGSKCVAGSKACSFVIVPSKPKPTACKCAPGAASNTDDADADDAATDVCAGIKCLKEVATPADDVCSCATGVPLGLGCAGLLAASPQSPGIELVCVRRPPALCTSGCLCTGVACTGATPVGACTTKAGGTLTDPCTWAIVVKAPVVACKCSGVNVGATDDTTVAGAECPTATLCFTPTTDCPCVNAATAPTGTGCPVLAGTTPACVRSPPSECASCTFSGSVVGTGAGSTCPANTACVRGNTVIPCTGKRKRRNVPVNLPKDSDFDNTELGSTIDSTIPKSGDVSLTDRQKRWVFTLWDTTTSIFKQTVSVTNMATTVSLSYACQPSPVNDVVEGACTG